MIAFLIYVISMIDSFIFSIQVIGIISTLAFIICYCGKTLEGKRLSFKNKEESWYDREALETCVLITRITKPLMIIFFISLFIPNSKTIAAMYLVPKIIENKQVSELPEKMVKLLNVKMDDWINDLAGEKK